LDIPCWLLEIPMKKTHPMKTHFDYEILEHINIPSFFDRVVRAAFCCALGVVVVGGACAEGVAPPRFERLRFEFPNDLKVRVEGESIEIPVAVSTLPEEADGEVLVELTLTDLDGGKQTYQSAAKPGKVVAIRVAPPNGWYAVNARLKHGGKFIGGAETSIAVLPDLPVDRSDAAALRNPFGVSVHFGNPLYNRWTVRELLRLSGLRWVRDNLYWEAVEPEGPGLYALPESVLANVIALRDVGIRSLLILGYGCPWYDHAAPEAHAPFERMSEFCSRALAGVVDHFEIWNEPNAFGNLTPELYPPILKAGYRGVKRGNPEAFVVGIGGASPGGWSGHYIHGGIIPQEAVTFMDTFSIHPYMSPSPPELGYPAKGGPAPLACLPLTRALTSAFAERIQKEKGLAETPRIWNTEMGWPVADGERIEQRGSVEEWEVTPAVMAKFTARAMLFTAAHPDLFERIFLYEFVSHPDPAVKQFGLVHANLSPRPAFAAVAVAARAIAERPVLRRIEHPDDAVHLYQFGPEEDPLTVGWVTELGFHEHLASGVRYDRNPAIKPDRTVEVEIPVQGQGPAVVMDWQGRQENREVNDGKCRVRLTTWPTYIPAGALKGSNAKYKYSLQHL
jgi:polysaccharide biosynthesis protein PslG